MRMSVKKCFRWDFGTAHLVLTVSRGWSKCEEVIPALEFGLEGTRVGLRMRHLSNCWGPRTGEPVRGRHLLARKRSAAKVNRYVCHWAVQNQMIGTFSGRRGLVLEGSYLPLGQRSLVPGDWRSESGQPQPCQWGGLTIPLPRRATRNARFLDHLCRKKATK